MEIIPVMDIKNGIAVRAREGLRDEYQPLGIENSNPLRIAEMYRKRGFMKMYIADLDGILKLSANWMTLIEIEKTMEIIVDVGIKTKKDIRIFKNKLKRSIPIVGTETADKGILGRIDTQFILSIDTFNGAISSKDGMELDAILESVKDNMFLLSIIVLDIARVGTGAGPNVKLCQRILKEISKYTGLNKKKICYGGGIRDRNDMKILEEAGIGCCLVGSMLFKELG